MVKVLFYYILYDYNPKFVINYTIIQLVVYYQISIQRKINRMTNSMSPITRQEI